MYFTTILTVEFPINDCCNCKLKEVMKHTKKGCNHVCNSK